MLQILQSWDSENENSFYIREGIAVIKELPDQR